MFTIISFESGIVNLIFNLNITPKQQKKNMPSKNVTLGIVAVSALGIDMQHINLQNLKKIINVRGKKPRKDVKTIGIVSLVVSNLVLLVDVYY